MTINDRIFDLAKKLAKALSKDKEHSALEEANYLSEETKQRIRVNLSKPVVEEQLSKFKEIDVEHDWAKVVSRLEIPEKSRRQWIYKAAAIALLLISGLYFTYNHLQNVEKDDIVQTSIQPATDKAVLILEDGTQVELSAETPFKNKLAQSNGDRLEYSNVNTPLSTVFNYLIVPRGGQYQLKLADGTEVMLNADTKIKYPVAFQPGSPRIIELLYGEIYLDVSPASKHQGAIFKIITKTQQIKVVGTEFNVQAYNEEHKIYTTLVDGIVQVTANNKKEELRPGEQSILDLRSQELFKTNVDVDYAIAWTKGYFHFRDKPLQHIMKVLSRWYDVEIIFNSPDLKNVQFSGLLSRKQTLAEILDGIKNTNTISAYEIKNKTITIR
jgi:ferric-dicitrate binding protein FerR (iron transport regulator)